MSYWVDSDVLVWAKDNAAPLGYAEYGGFWVLLDQQIAAGFVRITKRNFVEMTEGRDKEDELAKWLKHRRGPNLCVPPSQQVQTFARKIGDYVFSEPRFYQRHRNRFAKGADAWLIAQAAIDGGTVVTREVAAPNSHDPKIPDLCHVFGVQFIQFPEFMVRIATPVQPSKPKENKGRK